MDYGHKRKKGGNLVIFIANIVCLILFVFLLVHFYRKADRISFAIACFVTVLCAVNIIMYAMDIGGFIALTIETLETIFDVLWSIAMVVMVAATVFLFFVKKNEELATKFGITGIALLMMVFIAKELIPV